jgi:hypothetical protein
MAILKIYWDYVKCQAATNLRTQAKPSTVSYHYNVQPNCKGIYFRSVYSEELDFSDTLKFLKFEQVRRERPEGGNSLLFAPKSCHLKSIGVLRIMKPRKLSSTSGLNSKAGKTNTVRRSKDYDVLLETTEFVLEDAQEQMQERFQIQETFGDFNVFFFGKRAEIFTYSGSLLNGSGELQWRNKFLRDYDQYLRGSKCAELKARAYFLYDDIIREGFILGASTGQNSTVEGVVKFNFTMLITSKRTMGFIPASKSSSLTLDVSGDTKQGISDFQLERAKNPELPGSIVQVARQPGEVAVFASQDTFAFVRDESLKGTQPPDSLARLMQNLSLKAIDEIKSRGDIGSPGDTTDHDVLLEFLDIKDLPSDVKRAIAGKSLDIANISGDEVTDALIEGTLAVTSLLFKEAVLAATSFSETHSALIGEDLAKGLGSLGAYFSPSGTDRISNAQGKDAPYRSLLPNESKYILQESENNVLLTDVIAKVAPFIKIDVAGLTAKAVANVKVSAMDSFLVISKSVTGQRGSAMLQLYVAALALMRDPLTDAVLPAFSGFSGSIASNSVDYVKSQKFSAFAEAAKALPGQAATAFESAVDNFKASEIGALLSANIVGSNLENMPISEWTLYAATVHATPMSVKSARFMHQVSVYLSGILPEFADDIEHTSFDVLGGTVRKASSIVDAKDVYFTPAYAASLAVGEESVKEMVRIFPFTALPSDGTSTWYSSPTPSGDRYIMLPMIYSEGVDVYVKLDGSVDLTEITELYDDHAKLLRAGFIRLSSDEAALFRLAGDADHRIFGSRRKPQVNVPLADLRTVSTQAPDNGPGFVLKTNQEVKTEVSVRSYPVKRRYIGSSVKEYNIPAISLVRAFGITQLGKAVTDSIVLLEGEMVAATEGFTKEGGLPTHPDESGTVKAELSIEKLSTSEDIVNLSKSLEGIGASVADFLDLMFVANAETAMAESVTKLKDLLTEAVTKALSPEGKKSKDADDSDKSSNTAICKGG